jgi:hypothetical protein
MWGKCNLTPPFKPITYGDLFDYLEKYCNFHERDTDGEITWTCDCTLKATKKFCKDHSLFFPSVKKELENKGGYCDCEVLFNVINRFDEKKTMPRWTDKPYDNIKFVDTPDYVDGDKIIDYKTGMRKRIVWKKKVYGPDIGIRQEEVNGDPVTMPNVYKWYAYGNNRIVYVSKRKNYFRVELGKDIGPIGPTGAIIFQTIKEEIVTNAYKAVDLTEKWLFE